MTSFPGLKHVVMLEKGKELPGMVPFDKFMADPTPDGKARVDVQLEDPVVFIYTSGTTGVPKAAILTHKNLLAYTSWMINICYTVGENTVLMNVPLNHVGGAVMGVINCLAAGNKIAMMDMSTPPKHCSLSRTRRYQSSARCPLCLPWSCSTLTLVNMTSVRLSWLLFPTAPCPSELIVAIQKHMGVTPQNAYGLTEVSGAVTCTLIEQGEEKIKYTVGVPSPGIELAIMDDDGNILPQGEAGEIAIRGDAVMKGYWNRPDEDAKVFDQNGYFHTGDMGKLDKEGCLMIVGRKKEMYIRGGENVYPPEIEEAIAKHPDVFLSAVVGRPDPVMGEVGRAYIIPKPGTHPTAQEIKTFLKDKLVKYKIPEDIIFREQLPLTPLGKVKKLDLYQEIKREFA